MQYDSRPSVTSAITSLLRRHEVEVKAKRRLVDELTQLVLKAYEEGEDYGKRRERRRQTE